MRRRDRRGAPPPPPPAAPVVPRARICVEPSESAPQSGPAPVPPPAAPRISARRPTSRRPAWLAGWLAGEEEGGGETPRCLLALPAHAHGTPSLRVSGLRWACGHHQLSGEWARRAAAGPVRDAGEAGAQLPRWLLRAAGQPPLPPARPRAGGGGERSLRRPHPAPSPEEAPLSGAGPARPPPPPGSGARGGQVRAPRRPGAAGGRLRGEAGRGREMKGKQRGAVGSSFVRANPLTSFAFLT